MMRCDDEVGKVKEGREEGRERRARKEGEG